MNTRYRLLIRMLALSAIAATRVVAADDRIEWIQANSSDPYVWYHVKWADHDANHYVYVQIAMTSHPGNPADVGMFGGTHDYVIYCARGGFAPVHTEGGVHVNESEFTPYAEQPSGLIGEIAAVVCRQ